MNVEKDINLIANIKDIDSNFDCGLNYINEYIKNGHYPFLSNQIKMYYMKINDEIIGYSAFDFQALQSNEVNDITDHRDDAYTFGVIHLKYIAIKKNYQHKGHGTYFLRHILSNLRELHKILPLRFVIIIALSERKEWYENMGFKVYNGNDENPKMVIDLITKEEAKLITDYEGGLL